MKISIASDHGGFVLKNIIIDYLTKNNHQVIDVGCYSLESCNYPEFAHKAAELVENHQVDRGIVICTSGEGVSICANKHKGVRCGLIYNKEVASLTRLHNNVNMIALGAKFTKVEDALEYVDLFLNTPFEGGRHLARVEKIDL
jgi:ribose 5-phosphate isomerase B